MRRLTKSSIFTIAFFISVATIAILVSFFFTASTEEKNRRVAVAHLRNLVEINYELQYLILQSHAFQLENYDAITELTQRLERHCSEMRGESEALLTRYNADLPSKVEEYCTESRDLVEAVEDFKSANSLLANSVRFIPEIIEHLSDTRDRSYALKLYSDILLYCLQPSDILIAQINIDLVALPGRFLNHSRGLPPLKAFEKHSSVALTAARDRAEIEKKIVSPRLKQKIDALTDAYLIAGDKHDRRSQLLKLLAVGSAGLLMVALMVLLYRLQMSAESLEELNSTLEAQVDHRTSELKKALSELSLQQEMLAHSTKMSALGEMAGGIAHEINTPLTAISLKAEMLLAVETNPVAIRTLEEIVSIVERAAKIVLGLRKFSRTDKGRPFTPASVQSIIGETMILCREKFGYAGIQLELPKEECELEVNCVPEQIGQILLNLLNNSYDAVKPLDQKWVRLDIETSETSVVLRVTDSGPGIPEAVQQKLMQPFFTTKGVGKGTGIGLSISRGIAEKHGGSLAYDPSASQTSFKLTLPIHHRAAA